MNLSFQTQQDQQQQKQKKKIVAHWKIYWNSSKRYSVWEFAG